MTDQPVLTERRDGVLLIALNRPDARNAVNLALAEGIAAALDELDEDGGLGVGILTGAGSGFSAGMDLKPLLPWRQHAGLHAAVLLLPRPRSGRVGPRRSDRRHLGSKPSHPLAVPGCASCPGRWPARRAPACGPRCGGFRWPEPAAFVREVVTALKPKGVRMYSVWNEPNRRQRELRSGRRQRTSWTATRYLEQVASSSASPLYTFGVAWHPYQHRSSPRTADRRVVGIGRFAEMQSTISMLYGTSSTSRRLITVSRKRPGLFITEFGYLNRPFAKNKGYRQTYHTETERYSWYQQALSLAAAPRQVRERPQAASGEELPDLPDHREEAGSWLPHHGPGKPR